MGINGTFGHDYAYFDRNQYNFIHSKAGGELKPCFIFIVENANDL